ncbi:NAD(P)/FAD-dependent oxidoreductase [candidate division KSB1 bacterium]|nr:NAD(P)/FAD-dependent oxidoreductase [candidate division KSB1 bacterium]
MIARAKHIVILGGGFGGVYAAMHLEKIFARDDDVEIILISEQNYLLFTPMLPEVPSSSIEAKHIISPIRAFFRKVKFQNSEVHSIDLEKRIITASHCPMCKQSSLGFDYLVLALGSRTNFFGLPGVAENALPMKTLSDAMTLRNHIIDVLEHADLQTDPEIRKAMLTLVVAGGGFAGVETAAELRDFIDTARRYYPNIRAEEVRVVLVHAGSRIMPEISEDLADYALRQLKKRKVEVLLNTKVGSATAGFVELANKERIPTKTLIWTAGVAPSPLLATLPCARNKRGQIIVNKHLEVPDHPRVWALGDCAEILNPQTGQPYPPTAQHATREGKVVAANIVSSLRGATKKQFIYKPLGVLVSLGRRSAVAEILGFRFSGFFAWWLWRTIYLFKLPGLERKLRVAVDWTLDLFFPRDIVLLKVFMKKTPGEIPMDSSGMGQKELAPAQNEHHG